MTANLRISDIGGGRFVVEKRGEEVDVAKSADGLVTLAKSGSFSSWQIVAAMQELADLVAKQLGTYDHESSDRRFDRAYAKGDMSRIPRSAELMGALRELSALEKIQTANKAGPFGAPSALTGAPPPSTRAKPPISAGFRFTVDSLTGPPKVSPRLMDNTPRVLGPGDDGHLPTFQEITAQIAQANPAMYMGPSGQPNGKAIDRAMAERAGQDAL